MKVRELRKTKNKNDYGTNFIPPDGGFGWLICCASGISNMWIFCIFQNFGLIYQDKFLKIGLTNAEITAIPNTQTAISYFVGFLTGSLLKRFTYRQIGLIGSLCFAFGVFFMSFANSFIICLVSYGFIVGSGAGLCFPSSALAINTYFKEKRKIAHTISWTITGLGQIFMPSLVTLLLNEFNEIEASKIISALCLHMFVCSLIYQPVLWHVNNSRERNNSNLASLIETPDASTNLNKKNDIEESSSNNDEYKETFWQKVAKYFDLDLLRNLTFINIEISVIFPYLAEINFMALTPMFLNEFGFKQDQIIIIMTLPTFFDIIGRLVLPLILVRAKIKSRYFYLFGLCGQMIPIFIIANVGVGFYKITLISFLIFGLFRGLKTVYRQLIFPEFVPLERLSSAIGLDSLLTGFFALTIGSQIGAIRDQTNYIWLLNFLVLLIFIPVLTSILEFILKYLRKEK